MKLIAMYRRGEVDIDKIDCDSECEPTGKKLWICEKKWVPSYYTTHSTSEHKETFSYPEKDGPGEDVKDMGRRWEGDLQNWYPPKKEESLIDL